MILRAFQSHLAYRAGDKRLMLLYQRFLMLIFRHLYPNLPFGIHFQADAHDPIYKRILKDCRVANKSVHADALHVPHPLLGSTV
ncbi:hypothetical protein Hanom_Chr13g01211081 [Helianthus anomalus]